MEEFQPVKIPERLKKKRPFFLSIILALTIGVFAMEAVNFYPFIAGQVSLPESWSYVPALFYFLLSLLGIASAGVAYYGWRRWGAVSAVLIICIQMGLSLIFPPVRPLSILLKSALIAGITTSLVTVWKKLM